MSLEASMLALLQANTQANPALKRWVVAYSGGLDSTVLLHLLCALNQQLPQALSITALHINHQLSDNADQWQQHCERVAASLGVDFVTKSVEVASLGRGIEAAARASRYQEFEAFLTAEDCLLMGHHCDDQAETVLLRLMRGTGTLGLSAIPQARALGQSQLLRPLLAFSRESLQHYAEQHHLSWVDDESNDSDAFDRNYLRNQVMPQLMARWPQANKQLSKAANHSLQAQLLLNDLADSDLSAVEQRVERYGLSLDWKKLRQLSTERINNVLRRWCGLQSLSTPESQQLQEIHEQFFRASATLSSAIVRWGNVELRQFNQRLYLMKALPAFTAPDAPVQWSGDQTIALGAAGDVVPLSQAANRSVSICLSQSSLVSANITIRWRQGGERCTPVGRSSSQTVKKLLQEYQLETWLRDRVPLVYVGEELAAVGDLWVCQGFEANNNEDAIQFNWLINQG